MTDDDTASARSRNRSLRFPWSKSGRLKQKKVQQQVAAAKNTLATPTTADTKREGSSQAAAGIANQTVSKETAKSGQSSTFQHRAPRVSWFCRTQHFHKLCDAAFDAIDTDESGSVDEKELYSGLLLIHLKLGMYAGPAACRPLEREKCQAVFAKMDADRSGTLDKEEFQQVMMVLFGNVILRVIVQWTMTIMIVPLLARRILDAIYSATELCVEFIANLDEYSTVADSIEVSIESIWESISNTLPMQVRGFGARLMHLFQRVPDSVWNALPLTIISSVLGIIVVPWLIFKVDDLFQWLADRKTQRQKRRADL